MPFLDLQINGYAGVDFNGNEFSPAELRRACEALREDGVEGILATIITDTLPVLCARLTRIAECCERDPLVRELVLGIHLEGPFLNETPGYAGAHPASAMRPADPDAMKALLDAARGLIRLVTLAPERDPGCKTTRLLAERKILIAAGHTDCTRDELRAAIDNGLSMFTHFGNGCPMTISRHDNIMQRVLSLRELLQFSFIADGVHIPPFALKNYLDFVGIDRAVVVTDAMAAARLGTGTFTLGNQAVKIGADLVARSPDGMFLMGSTATMPRMANLLREEMQLSAADIERLTYRNPARLLGMGEGA
ncbi:MAG: N-acetylglucosamine-6-phosphate deacetylase [Pirellulales bacterium]|nr:N-acetylglucosamine-6-phosphate deacetylase [Pirellulales bacterium]